MQLSVVEYEVDGVTARISLNRPEKRNALNGAMIAELKQCLDDAERNPDIRVMVLEGKGKAFCAGADLNWMKEAKEKSIDDNYRESMSLAHILHRFYASPLPTIAKIHGSVIGGGNGLAAACDLSYSTEEAVFSLSEIKLGLVPAVISPYVIKRMGEKNARELMLTGERINGLQAEQLGLVNKAVPEEKLEQTVQRAVQALMRGAPGAMAILKKMINHVANAHITPELQEYTARLIAEMRLSEEAQEGMSAFLEKRKPYWAK